MLADAVQVDHHESQQQIHAGSGRRDQQGAPAGIVFARIGRHRPGVTDADQQYHQQPDRIDMRYRVERQSPGLLRGIVADQRGYLAVAVLVKRQREHQREGDKNKQQVLMLKQELNHVARWSRRRGWSHFTAKRARPQPPGCKKTISGRRHARVPHVTMH